ncbi:recombinase family protein [Oscillospiraceae bacterium LTW-04]|nr:recombinase family protein [Oscillospiraceae bacterium MB24-C1]
MAKTETSIINENDTTMNVVLYLRYSSEKQSEQSIEGQDRICRAFCERMGYTVVGTYIDRALSASKHTEKRAEFQRMIKESDKHKWSGVVVYKLDRFARDRYDSATYKARLKRNGVRVISATENISDNPEGIILEAVLEGMAEFYSKELSQKVTRGMTQSALKGNSTGGSIPLGYKIQDKKYVIDPLGEKIVKEAFELYAAGESVASICETFNNRGYRNNRGGLFNKNSFHRMFSNQKYIGNFTYKDIVTEGAVPSIIDRELFDKVQRRLKGSKGEVMKKRKVMDYQLTGKLFCGLCQSPMVGDSGTDSRGNRHYYYTCSSKKRFKNCGKKSIRKDAIEMAIASEIKTMLTDENINFIADVAIAEIEKDRQNDTLVDSVKQKLQETESGISNIMKAIEMGAVSPTLAERLNALEAEKKAYTIELSKEESRFPVFSKEHIVYWLSQFKDGSVDDEEYRRFLIDLLLNAAYVFDDPDGGYHLTLAFNLVKEKTAAISLSEISQAVMKCSDNVTCGSPKGTPLGVPFLVPKSYSNHVFKI